MNSYNPLISKDCKLTMQTTWIQYINWKRKIDNHFKYVEKLSTSEIEMRVLRFLDAMDIHWIKYIKHEIMANNVRDWQGVEDLIVKQMDELFPKMKRVMSAVTLTQDKGEDLHSFMSHLKIALDSVRWVAFPDERKKAIDLFQRITDEKLKDECMKKSNNDVEKFTIPFIVEINQKLKAGARDAWKQTENYGYVDKGVGNQNKNNNKPAPRVVKAAEAAPNRRERKKCKDCGHFH